MKCKSPLIPLGIVVFTLVTGFIILSNAVAWYFSHYPTTPWNIFSWMVVVVLHYYLVFKWRDEIRKDRGGTIQPPTV